MTLTFTWPPPVVTYPETKVSLRHLAKHFDIPWGIEEDNEFILEFPPQKRLMTYHDRDKDKYTSRMVWWPWTYLAVRFYWSRDLRGVKHFYRLTHDQMNKIPWAKNFEISGVFFAPERVTDPSKDRVNSPWLPNVSSDFHPCFGDKSEPNRSLSYVKALNSFLSEFFGNLYNDDLDTHTLRNRGVIGLAKEAKLPINRRDRIVSEAKGDPYPEVLKHWARLSKTKVLSGKHWDSGTILDEAVNQHTSFNFESAKSYL